MSLINELDDLVDAWHDDGFPDQTLEDVIRGRTGWTHEQFDAWVTGGIRVIRELCPRGFVPKQGFGNCRTCLRCGRQLEEHVPVSQ